MISTTIVARRLARALRDSGRLAGFTGWPCADCGGPGVIGRSPMTVCCNCSNTGAAGFGAVVASSGAASGLTGLIGLPVGKVAIG